MKKKIFISKLNYKLSSLPNREVNERTGFIAESSTGKLDVPKTTSGGICEIKANTGDIVIEIAERSDIIYNYKLNSLIPFR